MNRLWVWISVVVGCVVLFVSLLPFVYRSIALHTDLLPRQVERIPFDERNPEKFREMVERRAWIELSRTLAVGAVVGLIAGVLLTRWLVAPLRRLEVGARAIARRELDYRLSEKGSAEMRAVAASFNQMAAELERQESLRRDMLADVTHELRHPVHILGGNLQAILDGIYPLNMEEVSHLLEQTQLLAALTDDLHELAQAEAQQLPLFRSEIDLNELVLNTAEAFRSLVEAESITFEVETSKDAMVMEVDADRLRQALQNLLGNALRFTPQGGHINVSLSEKAGWSLVAVQDRGIGISPDDLPHVFDRFYRANAARSRKAAGSGLGLAISQAIIQAHGGQIEVESAGLNQGSRFTIRLPMEAESVEGVS